MVASVRQAAGRNLAKNYRGVDDPDNKCPFLIGREFLHRSNDEKQRLEWMQNRYHKHFHLVFLGLNSFVDAFRGTVLMSKSDRRKLDWGRKYSLTTGLEPMVR